MIANFREDPIAAVHIIHGMMEHSGRYGEFASWLAEHGIAVFTSDLPGHGTAVQTDDDLGHIAYREGWKKILDSVTKLQDQIRETHPGLPVIMFGHSFGSVVARSFAQRYVKDYPLQGLILSGAMQPPPALLRAGLGLIAFQKAVYGSRYRSKLLIKLGYGQYWKRFLPKRTDFDWLSSDPEIVDNYVADPLCGYVCTLGFYRNFFGVLLETWQCRNIRMMPPDLPVLFMGGQLDPAIRSGKDTQMLAERYRQCRTRDLEIKLWEKGRHVMLNEVNKAEVWEFLRHWVTVHAGQ